MASSVLALVGFIDDKWGMKPLLKLTGQIVVASILYFAGVHVGGIVIAFPPWLDYVVTVVWIVGAVNAFNLIDGMDGLATGLALIAAVGLAGSVLFTGKVIDTLPYLVLAGACLGFLRYNFHPASVFLGDTGSMFLGLCVATLPLITGSRKELVAALGVPLLAMGVPIFDTMLAIWRRTVRALLPQTVMDAGVRARVMQPDKDHIHHRLLRDTMNQRTAAIMLYGVSAVLVLIGLAGTLLRNRAPGLFLIAFIIAVVVVVRHLERVELWDTGRLLSRERHTIRQGLLVPLYLATDVFALCGAWVIARVLAEMPIGRGAFLANLPLFVVPVFVFMVIAKTYWRVWSRAQIRDFAGLVLAVLAGALLGLALAWLFNEVEPNLIRFTILFASLAVIPVVGMRLLRDSFHGVMQIVERRVLLEKPGTARALAYGGGVRFRSLLRMMSEHPGKNERVILGVIDDDIHLKGRIIAGHVVLGSGEDLEELAREWKIDSLIITSLLAPDKQAKIVKRATALGLRVSVWVCEERSLYP
jgi:UDP-N-acetylmuramyl pentapeptide phosphotransferase/UDP-N-acetylglucosamine-1-phosphate transferase